MEHPKSGKRLLEEDDGISERRGTVIVQTGAGANRGVTFPPNRPSGAKMDLKLLQLENEEDKDQEEEEEGELEDVQDTLKASCGSSPKCAELLDVLNECNDRVNSREKTLETCEQELFDFVDCVNACVVKELFNRFK